MKTIDSQGKPPRFNKGDKVVCYGKHKATVHQHCLQSDRGEYFWGMVDVIDSDGDLHRVHNWQCKKI